MRLIAPHVHVAIRLPSDGIKVLELQPNVTISLGKFGSFQSNDILGRPYHLTFEVADQSGDEREGREAENSALRIVPASELYADLNEDASVDSAGGEPLVDEDGQRRMGDEFEVVNSKGTVVMRTNRNVVDDPTRQKLSTEDIEMLKRSETGSGKELVAKILESHSALEQKTAFALAKYTLRKRKKYLRRFTVLPLDVPLLAHWILHEREAAKIMELREEMLALMLSWSNVHVTPTTPPFASQTPPGRWLVVDDTGGLVVAALAERLGILYPSDVSSEPSAEPLDPLSTNTLTLVHPASEPNLGLLPYFGYTHANPLPSHPLTGRLTTLSWHQLLHASSTTSGEVPALDPASLADLKSSRRAAYHRKHRRWARERHAVAAAHAGNFAGLIVATRMDPRSVMHHLVPLLRGGALAVVYTANVEMAVELADCYSTPRRGAFAVARHAVEEAAMEAGAEDGALAVAADDSTAKPRPATSATAHKAAPPTTPLVPSADFPLDPSLLLAPTVWSARARAWQVLPGRTHPLMTGRGGADGAVFVGTRVFPVDGKVDGRGRFQRRKGGQGGHVGE